MPNRRDTMLMSVAAALCLAAPALAAGETALEPAGRVDSAKLMEQGPLEDLVLGNADAPVTIVEYTSIACSHCAAFAADTLPAIKESFIKTGKAKLIVREFPLDARSTGIFMLARCVTKERYYPFIETLLSQQAQWTQRKDFADYLLQTAKLAGLTQDEFKSCLANQDLLNKVNAVRERASKEFGVTGTPTFFVNGKKYVGALSVAQMTAIIDGELQAAR